MKMEDCYPYPVFIECSDVLSEQNKKKVENYFKIKRKSGGRECGPVTIAADETYSIAFKLQRDQQEVLRRCEHTVELPSGPLVLIVTDKPLSSDSSSTSVSTAPVERAVSNKNNWDCISSGFGCVPDGTDLRRVVILGKTGSGKSSLGNTIFGENKFPVCPGPNACQSPCQAQTDSLNGRKITLIDTPGFFDTKIPEEKLKNEIWKFITECSPGLHAFLIVLELGRFTDQENDIIQKITESFSEQVFPYATVVFTNGENLPKGQNIKEYISQNESLMEIVSKCGGRCHVVDNKHWNNRSVETYRNNAFQVKEILKSIEDTVKQNKGNCYTNELLQTVQQMTQCVALAIVHEEQQAVHEAQLVVHEEQPVVHEEQPVVHEEQQAVHEAQLVVHEEQLVVHEEQQAVHEAQLVVHEEQQAVHEAQLVVHEEQQAVHEAQLVVHEQLLVLIEEQQQVARDGIWEKAKRRVWEMLRIVEDIKIGELLKALFGVAAAGAIVIAYLKFGVCPKGIDTIQLVQSAAVAAGALITFKPSAQQ